jgi:hypothetical protein
MPDYWNGQKYYECQLIALWNIMMYHGHEVPERYGEQYMKACEKAHALYPGLINCTFLILKMKTLDIHHEFGNKKEQWLLEHIPLKLNLNMVNEEGESYRHTVAAIGSSIEKRELCLANYDSGDLCWMPVKKVVEKLASVPSFYYKRK